MLKFLITLFVVLIILWVVTKASIDFLEDGIILRFNFLGKRREVVLIKNWRL